MVLLPDAKDVMLEVVHISLFFGPEGELVRTFGTVFGRWCVWEGGVAEWRDDC